MQSFSHRAGQDSGNNLQCQNSNFNGFNKKDIVKLVNSQLKLITLLNKYGIFPNNGSYNSEWSALMTCPLPSHKGGNERTASFGYNYEKDIFHCFGCGCGGGAVEFLSFYFNKNKNEIAENLFKTLAPYTVTNGLKHNNEEINKLIFYFADYVNDLYVKNINNKEFLHSLDKIIYWFDLYIHKSMREYNLSKDGVEKRIEKFKEIIEK